MPLSDEERIVRAIGNDPVAVSGHTNGQHWGGWTHRTMQDRDNLVRRLLPLLAECRVEVAEQVAQAIERRKRDMAEGYTGDARAMLEIGMDAAARIARQTT